MRNVAHRGKPVSDNTVSQALGDFNDPAIFTDAWQNLGRGPVMNIIDSLNPFARRVWSALSAEYPGWTEYLGRCGEDDLEVAVPAPPGSKAGHLVIFTSDGKDLWIRFSPPCMCYAVDDETEMLAIIRQLQEESALFVVTMQGDEWVGTTVIRPGDLPEVEPNQIVHVVSWSGKHDRTIITKTPA